MQKRSTGRVHGGCQNAHCVGPHTGVPCTRLAPAPAGTTESPARHGSGRGAALLAEPSRTTLPTTLSAVDDVPGASDVCVHLGDQRVHALVAFLPAQPVDEFDPERVAIQIAIEVEQVGLDAALAHLEGGIGADGDRRGTQGPARQRATPLIQAHRPSGIHTIGRDGSPRVGAEVCRRKSQLAATLVTTLDDANDSVRTAQGDGGGSHVPRLYAGADIGGTQPGALLPVSYTHLRAHETD